jgi:RNA polymerase sigma-70 factor (ECF subfamily)
VIEPDSAFHTRPSLLIRIRNARDDEAWSIFLQTYGPAVYRYCRRRGAQDGDAQDVTQEVMAQVAKAVGSFEYEAGQGRFRDWLGVVTRNKLTDHVRRAGRAAQARLEPDQMASVGTDPEWREEFDAQVYRAALERTRPNFEPITWRAFELVWIEGRPPLEAAAALGVPVDSVYVAKSRVLKRLREEVSQLADDQPLYTPLA